jgi:hypothetical protein
MSSLSWVSTLRTFITIFDIIPVSGGYFSINHNHTTLQFANSSSAFFEPAAPPFQGVLKMHCHQRPIHIRNIRCRCDLGGCARNGQYRLSYQRRGRFHFSYHSPKSNNTRFTTKETSSRGRSRSAMNAYWSLKFQDSMERQRGIDLTH